MGFTLPTNSNLKRIAHDKQNSASNLNQHDFLKEFSIPVFQKLNQKSSKFAIDTTNPDNMNSNKIQFDDATNLVNASLFYEHLERQIAQSRRDNSQFRIIRIILPDAISELSLLDFAYTLNQSTRNEDVVSRIGRLEFVVLLRINQNSPDKSKDIISRISDIYEGKFLFSTALINGGVDSITALELLDQALFKRSTNPN
ncbi:MAG: Diguanylate cyclase, domain [Actinomycetota bacterium]